MRVVRSANRFSQISVNIWAINAKHRHRKGRANTLFVIGRNIDGSMIDLRRFYLIISRPDRESSLIKDPSKVKGSYLLNLKLRENGIPKDRKKMSLMNMRRRILTKGDKCGVVCLSSITVFVIVKECHCIKGVVSEDIGTYSSYERRPADLKSEIDISLFILSAANLQQSHFYN